jgi:hypothetical protein
MLLVMPRTIRLARSAGLVLLLFDVLMWLFGCGVLLLSAVLLAGVALGNQGGAWLHTRLPTMLVEGAQPKPAEVAAASRLGFFSPMFFSSPADCLAQEWALLLDSLAFVTTYGKKNCLTTDMYDRRPLTLGKVATLVSGKLRDGTIRC